MRGALSDFWGKAYPANKSAKREKKASTVYKHLTLNGVKTHSPSKSSSWSLIIAQLQNRFQNIRTLRQDRVLEHWRVGDEGVERGHPSHRSVEVFEQFVGNARGDLGPVSPRERVF